MGVRDGSGGVNRYRPQRNWGARVLEYRYQGMRAVSLENELLRVGVLADKGTDVFEFNYKPRAHRTQAEDGGRGWRNSPGR